jgi:cysteine-rich repeat protein
MQLSRIGIGLRTFLAATAVLLSVGAATAQVSTGDRRCIEEINNGTRKVLLGEGQTLVSCKRSFLRGTLAGTIAACASTAGSTKMVGIIGKVMSNALKRCPAGAPPFGPRAVTAHPMLALQTGVDLMGDLFGPDVESALRPESLVKTCQENVLKAVQRCADTRVKEFNLCKKTGMKSGAIVNTATLEQQCAGTATTQPDPKGKIAVACDAKLSAAIERSCSTVGVSLTQAFPACGASTGAALQACLGGAARCRTCDLLNDVDGLAKDCDVFDDGNDGNQSCDEPTTCGDLLVDGTENCEDGNALAGDGCSDVCQREDGWSCAGAPSTCTEICGDGLVVGNEACDDGGHATGDGCDASCHVESGYSCSGSPSTCGPVCGDGQVLAGEQCDDGDTTPGDGCSGSCKIEGGYSCEGAPSVCARFQVTITSPLHGSFTTASSVMVTGTIDLDPAIAALTVNGVSVPVAPNGTFSTVVPIAQAPIFNAIEAILTDVVHGGVAHSRIVVHYGDSVADGGFSAQTVGLRLNDSGLDKVEPLVADLAGGGLDLADLVPVGTTLIDNQCFVSIFGGCIGRATVKIAAPPPSFTNFSLAADSMTNFVAGDITVNNIRVDVFLDGSGVVPDCPITLTANQAFFFGDYTLSPDASDPEHIDVVQQGPLDVAFAGFQTSFGGLCDAPIIGDIIQAFIPDVEDLTINAMRDFLSDPDGAGPLDSPTADAIEAALGGVSISGPIGAGLGVDFQTPLFAVNEDNVGITLGSNSRITSAVGAGPGQCLPPPGAPNLTASLAFNEPFPTYGASTPIGNVPYDVAVSISAEGFNQLLKAQTECGLLVTSINEIDLGFGPLPLTAGLLSALMPQFAVFPAATPFRIDIRPTLAPIVTGAAGPAGELTELRVANVLAFVTADDGSEEVALTAAFDAQLGMNAAFVPGALGIVLAPPAPGAVQIAIIDNPLGVNETTLETNILPPLVSSLIPDLASSLSSFPLPDFLGLSLSGLEVGRVGQFVSLYTNLTPAAP